GGTAGACMTLPWVTADGQVMPFSTGTQTTFTVATEGAAPMCEHNLCIPCGNPNASCAGIPGCEVADNPNGCVPRGTQGCCSQPAFIVPTFFVNILGGLCSRVDQIGCGGGVVNTSNPQTGHNKVAKAGDTSDPGADCCYNGHPASECLSSGGSQAPFGGDDPGCVPDSKDHLKCSDGAYKAFIKAYQAVIKCHTKQADAAQKGAPADDEACETSGAGKSAKEKLDAALAKLATLCTGTSVLANVATLETTLFAPKTTSGSADQQMGDIWCTGSTAIDSSGDDAGTVDTTSKDSEKCADGVGKDLSKLLGAVCKCHIK